MEEGCVEMRWDDSSEALQAIPYSFRGYNMAILQLTGLNGSVTPLPSITKTKGTATPTACAKPSPATP